MAGSHVSLLLLIWFIYQVIVAPTSSVAWYGDTDHYWHMNHLYGNRIYEYHHWGRNNSWIGIITGRSQITYSPVNVGLSIYGARSWLNLQSHPNSCFIEPFNDGFSIAFWVNIRDTDTPQMLLNFGGCDRGLTIMQTGDWNLAINFTSAQLGESWRLGSWGSRVRSGQWHHIVLTWSSTDGLLLYLNGSRPDKINTTHSANQTRWNASDWSMGLGRDSCDGKITRLDLDELALWSRVVSHVTVTEVYNWRLGVPSGNTGCPGPWLAHEHNCYYKMATATSWANAMSVCKLWKSNLVSIGSREENQYLDTILADSIQCMHIGLTAGKSGMAYQWIDGTVWSFNRLGNISHVTNASSDVCVYRGVNGTWHADNCTKHCGYVCKKHRGAIYKDGQFYCTARLLDQSLDLHRINILAVESELDCALECLIRGSGCRSFNYQRYTYTKGYPQETDTTGRPQRTRRICELNRSADRRNLRPRDGYQYCERVG